MTMTSDRGAAEKANTRRRPPRRWWPVAASVGSAILSSLLTVGLVLAFQARNAEHDRQAQESLAHVQQDLAQAQSAQRAALCSLVVLMNNAYRETPPITITGRNFAEALDEARRILDCPA
jgi:type II secretory pathway pseudopilin PulG